MSTDWFATVVVGYRYVYPELPTHLVPSCEHSPPPNVGFCPTCGVKIRQVEEPDQEMSDKLEEFSDTVQGKYGIVTTLDINEFWFGWDISVEEGLYSELNLPDLAVTKKEIDDYLKSLDLPEWLLAGLSEFKVWLICDGH